jgi:hypothetical protein
MTNQKCGYGSVSGECGEGRSQIRVARHRVSEDGGEHSIPICSNCLGFYFCSDDNDIESFGFFNSITLEHSGTFFEHLRLEVFNKKEWDSNISRKRKKYPFA